MGEMRTCPDCAVGTLKAFDDVRECDSCGARFQKIGSLKSEISRIQAGSTKPEEVETKLRDPDRVLHPLTEGEYLGAVVFRALRTEFGGIISRIPIDLTTGPGVGDALREWVEGFCRGILRASSGAGVNPQSTDILTFVINVLDRGSELSEAFQALEENIGGFPLQDLEESNDQLSDLEGSEIYPI